MFSLFTLALALAACGNSNVSDNTKKANEDVEDEVTPDNTSSGKSNVRDIAGVEVYVDEVMATYLELVTLGMRWDELREASASGEIDDYELGDIIYEEIIPLNMNLLEDLEAIRTPNEETTDINETLIEATGNQQLAFTEIVAAIESGDSSKITSANALLNDVRKSDREFARKLEQLLLEYGIELE